jgi:ornithine--oxo-acid transaminase
METVRILKKVLTLPTRLLNAVVVPKKFSKFLGREATAFDVCMRLMKEHAVLCKPTHEDVIRLAPALVIAPEDLRKVAGCIEETLHTLFKE